MSAFLPSIPTTLRGAADVVDDSITARFSDDMLRRMAEVYVSKNSKDLSRVGAPGRVPRYPRQLGLAASQATRER